MESDNVVLKIHEELTKSGATLAVAESLTGGEISSRLTDTPGSSGYFLCGICAYANEAKQKLLGVSSATLENYGAVSRECAMEMLHGIISTAGSDFGVATTGIAGPTGASENKPLGLVYIAVGSNTNAVCEKYVFQGKRLQVKEQAVQKGLELLNIFLVEGKS